MSCKKCKKELLYDNEEYRILHCHDCIKLEIESKSLWHKVGIKISEIKDLKNLNYSMNFILFDRISKLYNVVADNNFLDIVNFIDKWYNENSN